MAAISRVFSNGYYLKTSKMSGHRYMAEFFQKAGVSHIFLMPTFLYTTLVDLEGTNIKRILGHSEKAVAYMADGFARSSGKPGVVIVQNGPGVANVIAGLGEPWMAASPVIVLAPPPTPDTVHTDSFQELYMDFRPITKFSGEVNLVTRLPDMLRQAFRIATSGDPGPVHLSIQRPVEAAEAELPEPFVEERFTHVPAFRPEPEPAAIQEAVRLLLAANKPVIVSGGGAIQSEAWDEIVELAELLSIPVATTLSGKGTIAENHRLALGVVGAYATKCACDVVSQADLVFFIGTHTGTQSTNRWWSPQRGTPVIHLDINPLQIGKNYPLALAILGDAKVSIRRLVDALRKTPNKPPKTAWAEEARAVVSKWWSDWMPLYSSDDIPVHEARLCKELTELLPDDAILVSDTGYSTAWSGNLWRIRKAGRRYFPCAGTLGWAFPASLGVKCAHPDKPVVCFNGDGGFYYHLPELETALRWGLNTVTVVRNNSALLQDTHIIDYAYAAKGYDLSDYTPTNFAKVAQAFGAFGIRVEDPSKLKDALEQALNAGKPAVVDVVTDKNDYAPARGGEMMFPGSVAPPKRPTTWGRS